VGQYVPGRSVEPTNEKGKVVVWRHRPQLAFLEGAQIIPGLALNRAAVKPWLGSAQLPGAAAIGPFKLN
jgi:hypothetical protein